MKAVLHYRASDGFRVEIERTRGDVEVAIVDEDDDDGFLCEIADAEVLLHVLKPVTAAMIEAAPRLRLIQKLGVGVNTIDLDAARAGGVAVANMPGTNSQAVAEMTLTLMLAALRRIAYFDPLTRAGDGWHPDPAVLDGCGEIGGRKIGFFGFGAIPSLLAPAIAALGGQVIYCATSAKSGVPWRAADFDTLLRESDVLSLHTPLTEQTARIIDAGAIARMKPGSVLVNTARGGLVDEAALHAALASGRLGAAGLDVFAEEPAATDNPLFALPNVVVAPHVAWLTPETLRRSMAVAFANCAALREDRPLQHQVV